MPDGVVTVIVPLDAPTGTIATISVVEFRLKVALIPLKLTALGLIKLVPLIVTLVPGEPLLGENALIVGIELDDPVIVNPWEILKKILPTASTLTRALPVGVPGIVTTSEPSFDVLFARTIG